MKNVFFVFSIHTLLLLCALMAAEVPIAPENAVIVAASAAEQAAANELASHLQLITGKTVPVTETAAQQADGYVFYVGKAPETDSVPLVPSESRWEIRGDAAFFYGEGTRGSRNAVYDFLESELGIRWLNRDGDMAFPKTARLILKTGKGNWKSSFRQFSIRSSRQWHARQRQGAYYDVLKYGHAFTDLWTKYGKTKPEFFALTRQGTRTPILRPGVNPEDIAAFQGASAHSVKICTSSKALVEHVIQDWLKTGKSRYVNICENDGNDGFCCCADCKALDVEPETSIHPVFAGYFADRYIFFANRVAEAALKHRPDARVVMYAYNEYELPPRKQKVHPAVTIGIVPTVFDLEGTRKLIQGWKEAGMTEFFWRPNQLHYFSGLPVFFGFEKYYYDLFQTVQSFQPCAYDYSAYSNDASHEFACYILAKAMQDPGKPFAYWETHYLEAYGDAADEVGQFYRYWRKNWDQRIAPDLTEILEKGKVFNFARGMAWNLNDYFTEKDFEATGDFLNAAAEETLNENQRKLLNKLILAQQHARLIFRAVTSKTDEDAIALLQFRGKNQLEKFPGTEKYWGDVTGVFRVEQFREFTPPYIPTRLFWHFKLDARNLGLQEKWYQLNEQEWGRWDRMPTNGSWEAAHKHYQYPSAGTRDLTKNYDGIAWYATSISIPADWQDRDIFLYFGAVDESCWIYLNGKEAGRHIFQKSDDWNTPFTIRINDCLDWNRETQQVFVRVEDKAGAGGIWRRVFVVSKEK